MKGKVRRKQIGRQLCLSVYFRGFKFLLTNPCQISPLRWNKVPKNGLPRALKSVPAGSFGKLWKSIRL